MGKNPSISIITACYNSTPFIDRIYRSLRAQTNRNFEWICVDDCSTDDTVEQLLALDPPGELGMQVYRLPQNSGGSVALALGIQKARGETIVILDHDDELMDHALRSIQLDWPEAEAAPDCCGLLFQTAHPDGTLIGRRLSPGSKVRQTWLNNLYPDIYDSTSAIKTKDARRHCAFAEIEAISLGSVFYNEMTRTKHFLVGRCSPVKYYHRDNPMSQTNALNISRKWVYSYARLLDQTDRYALARPILWLRHAVALARFSKAVHGSYEFGCYHISRRSMRLFLRASVPFAWVFDRIWPKQMTLIEAPPFPLEQLSEASNLAAAVDRQPAR